MMVCPQHHPAIKAQRAAEIRLMQRLLAAGWCHDGNGSWFKTDDDTDAGVSLRLAGQLLDLMETHQ